MLKRSLFWCPAVILLPFSLLVLQGQTPASPVHVASCRVQSGETHLGTHDFEATLLVRFENTSSEDLKRIVWRAKYADQWLTFVDDGTFSATQQIDQLLLLHHHHRSGIWAGNRILFQDYTSTNEPENCQVAETTSQSGKIWSTSDPAPPPFVLPTTPPKSAEPVPATLENPLHQPVGVFTCMASMPGDKHINLLVRFGDLAAQEIEDIIFRVPYGSGAFDFDAGGSFAPGISITKRLDAIVPAVHALGDIQTLERPNSCAVVKARFADGTTWQNSALPAVPPPYPTPPPNAINGEGLRFTNTANYLDEQMATPAP